MIRLGRAFGIPIRLDLGWFVVFAVVASSLAVGYFPRALPTASSVAHWAWAAGAALLLFASLLAHELAHALTARQYGLRVQSIALHFLGGVSQITEEPPTPRAELLIAAAGPLTSFAVAGVAFGARDVLGGYDWLRVVLGYLGAANAVIGVFNLLPGFPLDGGRIVRAALWAWRGQFAWATRASSAAGRGCGVALAGLGVVDAVGGEFVTGFWLVMIGIFIYQSAHTAGALVDVRERLDPLPVEQVMSAPPSSAIAVDPRASVGPRDSAWLAFTRLAETSAAAMRVVNDGRVVGAVDRDDLKKSLPDGAPSDSHAA